MHDLLLAVCFVAMILTPCFLSSRRAERDETHERNATH